MNRVQRYIRLISQLHHVVPADQVERIAAEIRAIAAYG